MARIGVWNGIGLTLGVVGAAAVVALLCMKVLRNFLPSGTSGVVLLVGFGVFTILFGYSAVMQFSRPAAIRSFGFRSTGQFSYEVDADQLFRAFTVALPAIGIAVRSVDAEQGVIRASGGVGLRTWGERIRITVAPAETGGSTAVVTSTLKFGLYDWGKNDERVEAIAAAVTAALTEPATSIAI